MTPPRPRLTVVGSFAVGLTLRAERFPVPGETLLARDFDQGPGGKGSNQAVAAARLGADVHFVGAVGRDAYAGMADDLFAAEGVQAHLTRVEGVTTSLGFIILNADGENVIVLDPGANACLRAEDVRVARDTIAGSDLLVTVMEIPDAPLLEALRLARAEGVPTLLNPAPARPLPGDALGLVDIITPNETELRLLLGQPPTDPTPSEVLARELRALGPRLVVVTRGPLGALILDDGGVRHVPGLTVDVVDTTGAGDAFSAALGVGLARGEATDVAVARACAAGALAVTALGVTPALTTAERLDAFLTGRTDRHPPGA